MSLEAFVPTPRKIAVAGRDLEITPLKVRELPAFAAAIRPVAGHLAAGDIAAAMATHVGGVIDAVAIGARVEREWIDDLWPDQLAELAGVVFEVNADFFARRVLPATRAAAEKVKAAMGPSDGDSGSPGQSGEDTA